MLAHEALPRFINEVRAAWPEAEHNVLDIGSGSCKHLDAFITAGFVVADYDYAKGSVYPPANYLVRIAEYHGIWCSHVLEHVLDVHTFLKTIRYELKDQGVLCITVPPLKHEIVGGHVSLWNAGLLLYRLILAGFDCSQARVGTYGYNISVIVRKKVFEMPVLKRDHGDIATLKRYFPLEFFEGASGILPNIRW